ncbi:hypothetical protein TraAM80_08498 [Trypanosoma rangeli]|uniref:PH-like domain-containing protein n=1 Tax=Trypanosoma rangeli TaxID=5698 RepID=A0A3R7LKA3_TRYRA|nr:uncharacterized protein TraAM80_08498 [Trypanosoma rangeli]RNE98918.1 hypothetical protein TraAM80_08498 [Trypanosoma rangeli]|eukprot:RNE98918.1 hypothetical protein TraAM80_08498 [Trypanosoma rangeli]
MSRWNRTPHGRSAEVEDSIHYLRRYLGDAAPDTRQRPASSTSQMGSAVAAGVLPASVVHGEWGTRRTRGAVSPGKSHDQTPTSARAPRHGSGDGGGLSRHPSSPLRGEEFLHTEQHRTPREQTARDATFSFHEPLRLQYSSTVSDPSGRPPLPHHQQQQRQDAAVAMKGASTGGWEGASPRRNTATTGKEWRREAGGTDPGYQRDAVRHLGRINGDLQDRLVLDADASQYDHHYPHRRNHGTSHSEGLVGNDTYYGDGVEKSGEGEERSHTRGGKAPPTNRDTSSLKGGGVSQHRTLGSDLSPDDRLNASVTAYVGSGMRQSTLNGLPPSSGKLPGERTHPQDVFPYPKHEDNLRSMLFYLKNNYALEPQESLRGIETMTPEDVLDLVQCFYVDAYRAVRRARDAAGVGRAGFTEQDPPVDCVVGALSDSELPTRTREVSEEGMEATAPVPLPQSLPPSSSQIQRATSRQTPPQQVWRPHAAVASGGGVAAGTPSGRSHPPLQSRTPLEYLTSEGANASALSGGTLLSMEPPHEPGSGIIKRPLKELMPLLRRGSTLCKHVEDGRPHMRFFRVEDYLGEYRGKEVLTPHLVWYSTAKDKKPVTVLNLLSLLGVHILLADTSGQFLKLFRRKKGIVVDHSQRPVARGMCVVFQFESRDVAVSFLTEEDRQVWVGGMMGVVEKNRLLAPRLY